MASILAVDDDILLLQLIRKILERDGHRVTAVNDPLEVRKLSLSDYSLILLDVMMPGIDGFSLCREIRGLAGQLLEQLRALDPALFSLYGPSCHVMGWCPEGRLSCGRAPTQPPSSQSPSQIGQ